MLLIDDNIENLDLVKAIDQLSQQRREYISRFTNEADKRASTAAYLLLCKCLSLKHGINHPPILEYGEHGKPFLRDYPHIHFNFSHCRTAAVCAISEAPIGVDIESIRSYNRRLAMRTMNEKEFSLIETSAQPDVAFTRLWTQKEAIAKLSGRGLYNIKELIDNFNGTIKTTVNSEKGYIYSICQDLKKS